MIDLPGFAETPFVHGIRADVETLVARGAREALTCVGTADHGSVPERVA